MIDTPTLEERDQLFAGMLLYDERAEEVYRVNEELNDGYSVVIVLAENSDRTGNTAELPDLETMADLDHFYVVDNAPAEVQRKVMGMRLSQVEASQEKIMRLLQSLTQQ